MAILNNLSATSSPTSNYYFLVVLLDSIASIETPKGLRQLYKYSGGLLAYKTRFCLK